MVLCRSTEVWNYVTHKPLHEQIYIPSFSDGQSFFPLKGVSWKVDIFLRVLCRLKVKIILATGRTQNTFCGIFSSY
jgi:hypothetical protein